MDFGWAGEGLLFATLTGRLIWLLPFTVGADIIALFHTMAGLLILVPFTLGQLSQWLVTRPSPRLLREVSADS
jgi:hypothetical protein